MMIRYRLAKMICPILPPIFSQSIRNQLISLEEGELLNLDFTKKGFTGSHFVGNTSDFHAFKFSIHGFFDWRNIVLAKEILKVKKGHIVEVGANIGTETISFCDIAIQHKAQVYAFEPLPSNVASLIKNKEKNKLKNLEIMDCLLSDSKGSAYFNVPTGNNSGSGHITGAHQKENVQEFEVKTLDDQFKNEIIALVAIDVEGFEYNVLRGGEDIIKKNNPVLILEVNKKYLEKRGHIGFMDFYNYLVSLGYDCYSITRLGIKKVKVSEFKSSSNKNWVCISTIDRGLEKKLNRAILYQALNPLMSL